MRPVPENTLRAPVPEDLWWGGRRLFQLLTGMAARDMASCALRVLPDRGGVAVLTDRDGLESPGPDWSVMETCGAILFLQEQNLTRWKRGPDPGPGKEVFIVETRSGLLPPEMPALRVEIDPPPGPELYLGLHVLTEEEARVQAAALLEDIRDTALTRTYRWALAEALKTRPGSPEDKADAVLTDLFRYGGTLSIAGERVKRTGRHLAQCRPCEPEQGDGNMRRVDLTPNLPVPAPADLHAGSRRMLALLDGLDTTRILAVEMSVLEEGAVLRTLSEDGTRELKPHWPVMEAFGALVFLINQSRPPEQRSLHVRTVELGFLIGSNSGLLPPGILSLRGICGLYPPPDMFAVLNILRDSGPWLEHVNGFAEREERN